MLTIELIERERNALMSEGNLIRSQRMSAASRKRVKQIQKRLEFLRTAMLAVEQGINEELAKKQYSEVISKLEYIAGNADAYVKNYGNTALSKKQIMDQFHKEIDKEGLLRKRRFLEALLVIERGKKSAAK
jgi:hypothetical protein